MGDELTELTLREERQRYRTIVRVAKKALDKYSFFPVFTPQQVAMEDRRTIEDCISAIDMLQYEICSDASLPVTVLRPFLLTELEWLKIFVSPYINESVYETIAKKLYLWNPSGRFFDYARRKLRVCDGN